MRAAKGFSLIELMITIVILGIVASFAFAGYQEQVRDARRGDCSGALVSLSQAMERFYSANNSYLGAASGGSDTGAPAIFPASCPTDGGTAFYNVTIETATASTYTLQAAPIGGMAEDKCGTLTLTSTGVKGVADADAGVTWEDCW
jgi:type IV pilus assembly protein PilE